MEPLAQVILGKIESLYDRYFRATIRGRW